MTESEIVQQVGRSGYCILPGMLSEELLAPVLGELVSWHDRMHGSDVYAEVIKARLDHAPECYECPFWSGISVVLKSQVVRLLGGSVRELGRQLIGSYPQASSDSLYAQPHIDTVSFALRQSAGGGEPIWPRFQLLAGVYLTDVPDDRSGGLWVWPDSVAQVAEILRQGTTRTEKLQQLLSSVPASMVEAKCITGRVGDVILLHPYLLHATGINQNSTFSGRLYLRFGRADSDWRQRQLKGEVFAGWGGPPREETPLERLRELIFRREYSLYSIDESARQTEFLRKYTLFKLGDVETRRTILREISALVRNTLPKPTGEWAVATSSTNHLAEEFAELVSLEWQLATPLDVLRVSTPATPGTDYTDCSEEDRQEIAKQFFEGPDRIYVDGVIIVDDMLTTGTALGTLVEFLTERGVACKRIYPFVFVRSYFETPGTERELVDEEIASMEPQEIAAVMNHPDYYVTSGTMFRHLRQAPPERLRQILNLLTPRTRALLAQHAREYYGADADDLGGLHDTHAL